MSRIQGYLSGYQGSGQFQQLHGKKAFFFFGCAAMASFAATGSNIVPRITRMMLVNSSSRLAKGEG